WRAVHEAVENGLEQGSLPYVVGVPLRMVESWALGDADALEQVAGRSVSLPGGSPELLWGAKRDDGSNYPKHVLQRALDDEPNAEVFAQIASAADLDVIANRCPVSFAPFLNALRSTASICTTVP
ncbi:MAG: DUF4276 family protein, partial [Myxococcales bacterium]|nr:DUF4276 family protein [Myxococcales bacterium]